MNKHFPGLRPARQTLSPDIIVGLGARACASAQEIVELVDATLDAHGLSRNDILACVTVEARRSHAGLLGAAQLLEVPLISRDPDELATPVPNPSLTVLQLLGISSVAEAAALSFGPLVAPKHRSANATCALSQAQPSSAAMAASTLTTSSAGP